MIAFLNGTIAAKGQSEVLMDVGGIGFQASCSTNTLSTLPQKGEACLLWIYMSVRDDGVDLYGFSSQEINGRPYLHQTTSHRTSSSHRQSLPRETLPSFM